MQRVRMSLPYFKNLGWHAEVVIVDQAESDMFKDELLSFSIPNEIKIHQVSALPKKYTAKFGLGSLALRSMWFYYKYVNNLLKKEKFDLIYFSTTQFPITILGAFWKKKFGIPYVIDMQDPWHTTYYQNKPKQERPPKYWFSYRLNKWLEPLAMKQVDGIISVSADYVSTLQNRYPRLKNIPFKVITFGAFDIDFNIAAQQKDKLKLMFEKETATFNLVYVGRGGHDMKKAIETLFSAFKLGLIKNPLLFNKVKFHFIGTSYAPKGFGKATILPIAKEMEVANHVNEVTDRIGFYESMANLSAADGLIILGSEQAAYTASKLYPYILAKKQLLAIFHPFSSVSKILKDCNAGFVIPLEMQADQAYQVFNDYLKNIANHIEPAINWQNFNPYTAAALTKQQTELFNQIIP